MYAIKFLVFDHQIAETTMGFNLVLIIGMRN